MALNEFICICFFPTVDNKHPIDYHVKRFDTFDRFASKKGFIYYNQYQKETGDFIRKRWFPENFPRNKNLQ